MTGFHVAFCKDKKEAGFSSRNNLTTYGALSCELAFLQSLAICFDLVDQSVGRK